MLSFLVGTGLVASLLLATFGRMDGLAFGCHPTSILGIHPPGGRPGRGGGVGGGGWGGGGGGGLVYTWSRWW